MLTQGIAKAYDKGTAALREVGGVGPVAEGTSGDETLAPAPLLTEARSICLAGTGVTEEVFGASGVVVRYADVEALVPHLTQLEGQLTATIHYAPADAEAARRLLPVLEEKAGRILFNGWPTGVEV